MLVRLPVSRSLALERAALRLIPGLILLSLCFALFRQLRFQPTAVQNRLTDYSLFIVMIPFAIGGLVLTYYGLRWLALAFWPAATVIEGDEESLTFHLGPFGTKRYEFPQLQVHYLFELPDDAEEDEGAFEAFLDAEEQMEKFLPRIRNGRDPQRLDLRIMHYTRFTEAELVEQLRRFVEHARRDRPAIVEDE